MSDITASSEIGLDGTVVVEQVVDEVEPDPIELPDNLVNENERLTAGCLLDEEASFVATGRGGIPLDPGEWLNQTLIWTDPRGMSRIENEISRGTSPAPAPLNEAQSWQINNRGQVELIALTDNSAPYPKLSCQRM